MASSEHSGYRPGYGSGAGDHGSDALVQHLSEAGVAALTTGWVDNNGIVRSRTVPRAEVPAALRRGIGVTTVFAVFDSHDGITFAHEGLSTPSGDVRLMPVADRVTPLAGEPGFAWAPGTQRDADGGDWPYDQRAVLERQVQRLAEAGLEARAGFELEMVVCREDGDPTSWIEAHHGPAYGPNAVREVGPFVRQALEDLEANGLGVGQLHAEVGASQLELALSPLDPLAAADAQVLARQTLHAAARAHGLRLSFAPVTTAAGAGNGWHLHTSLLRDGENVLTGDGAHGLSPTGARYLAGLLRELPGIAAVAAPSTGSLLRRRPHYWAGAYACWGVENREAALRLVPASALLGPGHTNVELKPSDASGNPYLSLAVVLAAGLAGIEDAASLPDPVQEDVGNWDDERRAAAGIVPLATTHEQARADLLGSAVVGAALGPELLGAFAACRDADAAWAAEHTLEETIASLRWQY